MLNNTSEEPKRLPNNPASPADATDAAAAIAAEIAILEEHDENEERRLLRYLGNLEPCQLPKLLRIKSTLRARYALTERVGLLLAVWHYHKRRSRYLHGAALVAYKEQRERGRAGSLRAKLMSCHDEIAAMHTDGMSYPAICRALKKSHEKLFRGLHIDAHYLAHIMRTASSAKKWGCLTKAFSCG